MSPPPPLPTDPDAWGAFLCAVPAPILADTAEQLTELALLEERCGNVDAHMIADAVRGDPLMTMRVLSHAGRHRGEQPLEVVENRPADGPDPEQAALSSELQPSARRVNASGLLPIPRSVPNCSLRHGRRRARR